MRKIFLVLLLGLTVLATVSALVEAVTMSKTTESGQTAEDLAKGLTADEEEEETVPSLLLESILNSDYDSIQAALESGEDINTANMNGWSATMMAVFAGDLSVISFLIDNGADINLGNIDGVTPLMLATAMNNREAVELLLAGGANVFLLSSDGTDAYARCQRQIVCLQLAEAMLQQAIYGNSVEYLEQIVVSIRNGAYIDMRVGNGWTPLMHLISLYEEESEDMISDAVRKVNNDVLVAAVTELLEAGADIHATEDENGWTALHFAASVGSPELFTLLQEHGADSTAITADGLTVRDIALNEQRPALLELILTSTEQEENEEL